MALQRPGSAPPSGAAEPWHPNRPSMLGIGTIIWLASELMFFSGLFAAYFTIRAQAAGHPWPPHPIKLDILQSGIFTAILLASSFTMQKALFDEEKGNRRGARIWLVTSFFMGLVFVLNQAYEWQTVNFTPKTNAYGSMFFLMSGLHGLHVIVGLVAMIGLYGRMAGQRGDPGEAPVFQAVSYYWHFVDVVWVGLYSALFLLK